MLLTMPPPMKLGQVSHSIARKSAHRKFSSRECSSGFHVHHIVPIWTGRALKSGPVHTPWPRIEAGRMGVGVPVLNWDPKIPGLIRGFEPFPDAATRAIRAARFGTPLLGHCSPAVFERHGESVSPWSLSSF